MRDAVGRGVDIAARHPEGRVADEKGREENHEVFQLETDGRADQSNGTAEKEDRNRRGDERGRDEGKDGIDAGAHVALQEPPQRDVATVEGGQHAGAKEDAVGAEDPRVLAGFFEEQTHDRVMAVDVSAQTGVQILRGTGAQRPEREEAVKQEQEEKLHRPEDVSRGDGDAFAVHLNGALPLLQVKPRSEQESDEDRHHVAPVVEIAGR